MPAIVMAVTLYLPFTEWLLIGLLGVSYLATVTSLDFDLYREEWIVLPLYGLLVTLAIFTGAAQFATSVALIGVTAVAYGLVVYGTLLTLNILNVATVRALPLARAANTVLSMMGLVVSFGIFYLTLTSQPSVWQWMLLVALITFLVGWPLICIRRPRPAPPPT